MLKFSNRVYDVLKKISMMAVPITTLIASLSKIWGFTWGTEVCATISALGIFLGACLEISTRNYNDYMINTGDDDAIPVDKDGGLG